MFEWKRRPDGLNSASINKAYYYYYYYYYVIDCAENTP